MIIQSRSVAVVASVQKGGTAAEIMVEPEPCAPRKLNLHLFIIPSDGQQVGSVGMVLGYFMIDILLLMRLSVQIICPSLIYQ